MHTLCKNNTTWKCKNMCNLYWCSLASHQLPYCIVCFPLHRVYIKHTRNINSFRRRDNSSSIVYCLLCYLPKDMWSIMALTFENGNYMQAYKGHLEIKTTIKSISIWCYLYKIYGKPIDTFGRFKFWLPQNLPF